MPSHLRFFRIATSTLNQMQTRSPRSKRRHGGTQRRIQSLERSSRSHQKNARAAFVRARCRSRSSTTAYVPCAEEKFMNGTNVERAAAVSASPLPSTPSSWIRGWLSPRTAGNAARRERRSARRGSRHHSKTPLRARPSRKVTVRRRAHHLRPLPESASGLPLPMPSFIFYYNMGEIP